MPPLSQRVRRGVLWSSLSTLVLRLANVAITAVVAHILAPRDFGVFAVALTAFSVVSCIGELGLGACIIRADLDIDAIAPTMVTVSLVISAILAAAMAVSARPIATALGSAQGAGPIRIMALVVLINGFFTVPSGQLTREFRQATLFWANVSGLVPSTAALLILAKTGSGATAFAWSRVISQLVMGCVMMACVPRIYMPRLAREPLSVLLRFGFPLAAANIIYYILINVDYAFVGHLMGAVALGVYMLAFTLASAPGFLLGNVINSIAMPAFSRVKQNPELLHHAMAAAVRAVALILLPMCSLMMVLARPLVLTLYGAKWAAAAEVLSILSFYGIVATLCILFANMLASLGLARLTLAVQLVWLGALIPAMALGVRRSGIVGAAAAHVVVIALLVAPCYLVALKRASGAQIASLGRAILPAFLAASLSALAARAVSWEFASPLAELGFGLAAGGSIYLLTAAGQLLAWLSPDQTARLRRFRLFRLYMAVGRMVTIPASAGPVPGQQAAEVRPRHRAAAGQRRHVTSGPVLPSEGDVPIHRQV